jgi:peroxiredoxin
VSESTPPGSGAAEGSEPSPDGPRHVLDPDKAVAQHRTRSRRQMPQPVIDTRPYRWAIGIFGIVLVIVLSVIQFASTGVKSAGVQPGHRLLFFAAPVATSNLVGDANFTKPCALGYFGARAVNTCLLVRRGPLVLGLFVTGSSDCKREIDTMQKVSAEFPASTVQFAAVAVQSSKADALRAVRAHHWTFPIAYDRDGAVGQLFGVQLCPMLELAYRGGTVKSLLFGDKWLEPAALAAQVRALVTTTPKG